MQKPSIIYVDWVINTLLIFTFVVPHCPSFLESPNLQDELLDTPTEYENAVENSHKKRTGQKRFAAQKFWQNCYWLDFLNICEIFPIIDLVMCNITAQKNITCQKESKDKLILSNNVFWLTCIEMNPKFILLCTCMNYFNNVLR